LNAIVFIYELGRQTFMRKSAILIFALLIVGSNLSAQIKTQEEPKARDFTSRVWLSSHLLPGSGQIINKQYWKTPIYYGGMGGMIYLGVNANKKYLNRLSEYNALPADDPSKELFKQRMVEQRQTRNLYYAAAGAFYVASVVDAVYVYNQGKHSPAAATIFSTIVPGLGQTYNKKYWKVPVVYGGLSTFYFIASWNNRGYKRFKTALKLQTDGEENEFGNSRTDKELKYFMDNYRRNRDFAILGFAAIYVLNILDANVDAHLYDWNVNDNLGFKVEPTLINSDIASTGYNAPILGISCRFSF